MAKRGGWIVDIGPVDTADKCKNYWSRGFPSEKEMGFLDVCPKFKSCELGPLLTDKVVEM